MEGGTAKNYIEKYRESQGFDLGPILVVEDDRVMRARMLDFLHEAGHTTIEATNGQEALDLFQSNRIRVVISDWNMPELSGLELCAKVREIQHGYTYFLLVTSNTKPEQRLEAFHSGVDELIGKPFDEIELLLRLSIAKRILQAESKVSSMGDRLKAANVNLETASRRFEELFHGLPVPCFTVSIDGIIHEWNREAEEAFGIQAPFAFQQYISSVLGDGSAGFWNEMMVREIAEREESESCQWSMMFPDGGVKYFAGRVYPFYGAQGNVSGVISANIDVTDRVLAQQQLEEVNQKLEVLSITDGLTGLRNRRSFQEALEHELRELRANHGVLSLILMDIDHFKKFNDTFGHVAGDSVLKTVAKVMQVKVKDPYIPARYGGEEFAVILPGLGQTEAMAMAERIRLGIESQPWVERQVTGSFGVATTSDGDLPIRDFIELADSALYASKESGRNRATHVNDLEAAPAVA